MTYYLTDSDLKRVRNLSLSAELSEIIVHEQSSKRNEEPNYEIDEDSVDIEISLSHRIEANDFGIRLQAEVSTRHGETNAVVSGEYELADGFTTNARDVLMFANEIAILTIFPYLRELVSDSTNRVFDNTILMPAINKGDIAFDLEREDF